MPQRSLSVSAMSAYRFLAAAGNPPFRSQLRCLPVSSRHLTPPQDPASSFCRLQRHQRFLTRAMSAYRFLVSAGNLPFRSATARSKAGRSRRTVSSRHSCRQRIAGGAAAHTGRRDRAQRRRRTPARAPQESFGRALAPARERASSADGAAAHTGP